MLVVTPLIVIIFLICLAILYSHRIIKKPVDNFPPGPPKLPIWGSYWFIIKENYKFLHLAFEKMARDYKTNILGIYLGDMPAIVTLDYNLTKQVMTRDEFIGRVNTVQVQVRSEGDPKGIFFSDGAVWKSHRRFSLRHLRDYGFGRRSDVLENFTLHEIKEVIHFLQNEPQENSLDVCKQKGQVLIPDFLYGALINPILLPITSTQIDHCTARKYGQAAFRFMKSFDATGNAIAITPWLRLIAPDYFGYTSAVEDNNILKDFMRKIVDEHLQTFSDDHHRDFIDDFISENIRQGTDLDYKQLILTAIDYMFPSPIGVGHSLSFFFALLINNPQIQKNIQQELDRIIGSAKYPSLDDRPKLPYLDASIRESLRMFSVTPLGLPKRCVEDTTLGGYFIPKDTCILPNLWTAHRDEAYFPNPNVFKPERFLNPDGSLMKKDITISFGAGKRLCAGETFARNTMFLISSCLLQNFSLEAIDSKPIDLSKVESGITLSLKPTWIQFIPR